MKNQLSTGIAAAVAAAGSQIILGQQLGVSQQAINKWCKQGWVPLMRAGQIEALYNISRTRLANPKIVALLGATKATPTQPKEPQ
ncbi:helix-turn-helix domain-containing protein [Oxalobacteraceae bacterium OTU3CINTB1]|nr:helix-turn-helix domain-containing protein [Oxalobacteraceae bacterium OTU3CINTB1]